MARPSIQRVFTPPIADCAICGAKAMCIDWHFRGMWRVMCDNNHTATRECGTTHRAICRWNNAQARRISADTLPLPGEVEG